MCVIKHIKNCHHPVAGHWRISQIFKKSFCHFCVALNFSLVLWGRT